MDQGVPSIDENGNYYLYEDGDVVYDYSGEKKLEAVLDNVILLINHFVKENYSMEAIHQIQRFYIEYHESLEGVSFEELSAKIGKCFSVEGADPETLNQTVIEVFGYNRGDEHCIRTMKTYCYRVAKYIGSYVAAMNGVDVICFTAGIGENAPLVRSLVCEHLGFLGVSIDEDANHKRGEEIAISTPDSKTTVMVIPTNEELAIARETVSLVK